MKRREILSPIFVLLLCFSLVINFLGKDHYLKFSDAAKYGDIARNVIGGDGFTSRFNFWGANNVQAIQPVMPYSIAVFFKLFGVNDLSVMATSAFYFLLFLVFIFLLAKKLFN